ncbi:MAG: glycosyltransferase family 39 protein [Planctomycetota bacterium]|nr:glycosyltransferase family 39 protein [Planctomycetota bacterium]
MTHASLLAWGATLHSPNVDEAAHLVAGLSHWTFARFDLFRVNPPLVRMVASLPVLVAAPKTDWSGYYDTPVGRPEFKMANDFINANGSDIFRFFTIARWACIPFSALGGYVCYRWAMELYGAGSGILAAIFWCFSPMILGHGQLITPDVPAAALGLAAVYRFWIWLKNPAWPEAILAGLALGVAQLCKTTLILLFGILPVLWLAYLLFDPQSKSPRPRNSVQLAAVFAIALFVLNGAYAFHGSFTPLGEYRFVSATLAGKATPVGVEGNRFTGTLLSHVAVPLPRDYVRGIDLQKRGFDVNGKPSYLRGEFRSHGWWHYYLYALAVKVPIGTWLLAALACGLRLRKNNRAANRDDLVVLLPLVVILIVVSSQTGFSRHLRYLLPAFPFAFVWISQVAQLAKGQVRWCCLMIVFAVCMIVSSVAVYPHSLSYFNQFVGGPSGGRHHLLGSNLDWSQDLLFLRNWMNEHPEAAPIKVAYSGPVSPTVAGIDFDLPAHDVESGWFAVSVNTVCGYPAFVVDKHGRSHFLPENALSYFQQFEPLDHVGYSIDIYYISPDQAEQLRRSLLPNR